MHAFKEIEARVSGKVQGVFFRVSVQKKASALFLSGTVRNAEDRSVHVIAQGHEEKLKSLIDYLHKGPFGAHVSDVQVEWREPTQRFEGFTVVY